MMDFHLEPIDREDPPLIFSFDEATQTVSGPDADFVMSAIESAKESGEAYISVVRTVPIGQHIGLDELSIIIVGYGLWHLSPPLRVPKFNFVTPDWVKTMPGICY